MLHAEGHEIGKVESSGLSGSGGDEYAGPLVCVGTIWHSSSPLSTGLTSTGRILAIDEILVNYGVKRSVGEQHLYRI